MRVLRQIDHDPGPDWPGISRVARIREGGYTRHMTRVYATLAAAAAWTSDEDDPPRVGSSDEFEAVVLDRLGRDRRAMMAALIAVDLAVWDSRRHQAFCRLGAGRWQARDGGAWWAAAEEALAILTDGAPVHPQMVFELVEHRAGSERHALLWCLREAGRAATAAYAREVERALDRICREIMADAESLIDREGVARILRGIPREYLPPHAQELATMLASRGGHDETE